MRSGAGREGPIGVMCGSAVAGRGRTDRTDRTDLEGKMHPDAALTTFHLDHDVTIAAVHPGHHAPVALDSPALAVMTDLTQVKAATIPPTATLRQAEQMMIYQGVRMLFVVTAMPSFDGLITASDLRGERPLRIVNERHLRHDELCVGDVMTPLALLEMVDFDQLRIASVGNLIASLKRIGTHHLLVTEQTAGDAPARVRGVVSRAQIERQLGMPIEITPIASSFSEIERALS